ncbi:MAG: peptidoglycan DD-metalloendopeptidase family protein [Elusimicrobia bacterium]|nr:peptidoglycan DD-metalloendopeptidase family protein [Elusimicrobiota bacterium]
MDFLEYFGGLIEALKQLSGWLKRFALYGLIAAGILLAYKSYQRLLETSSIEFDARGLQVYSGDLGGRSLQDRLIETGSSKAEVAAILKAAAKAGGHTRTFPGDTYEIALSTADEFLHLTLLRGLKRIVVKPKNGGYSTALSSVPVSVTRKAVKGEIRGSLWLSMQSRGVPATAIQEFADIFQWSVDFLTETQDGDRFAMAWDERTSPDGRNWGRTIASGVYNGRTAGRNVGILFNDGYYDAKGESLQSMFLKAPLNYRRISSYFSSSRYHPILKKRRAHHGTDYSAPLGTPVSAVGGGVVVRADYSAGIGNAVAVRHSSSYTTLYGHLKGFAKGIRAGVHVRQGQVVGYVGSTGLSTGPHLHFQMSKNGQWANFLRIKTPRTRSVPAKQMPQFAAMRDKELKALGEYVAPGAAGALQAGRPAAGAKLR